MTNSMFSDDISMFFTSLAQGLGEDLSHPIGFLQIVAIGVSYLIAWLLARKLNQYLEKDIEKVKAHIRFVLSPAHFAIILRYVFWLLLVWFCQAKKRGVKSSFFTLCLNLSKMKTCPLCPL